jgi:hypothetical protein
MDYPVAALTYYFRISLYAKLQIIFVFTVEMQKKEKRTASGALLRGTFP